MQQQELLLPEGLPARQGAACRHQVQQQLLLLVLMQQQAAEMREVRWGRVG
jgi:hypothetical protein